MRHLSYASVPKPLEYRLGELVQSLSVIRDSLGLLRVGHAHQVPPIAGQLRALLTDRAAKPLLYAVAESLDTELMVWTEGGLRGKRGPDQPSVMLFGMSGIRLTATKTTADQVQVPLAEALDAVVLHAQATNFSARDVIDFYANKAGGAHFADELPSTLASVMATIQLGDLPAPATAVLQFGQAALALGRSLLRELTDVDIDLVLYVRRPRPEGPSFLFDARCTTPRMRLFGQLSPNLALTFGVEGVGGQFAATAQNAHDWAKPHHIRFSTRLLDDLNTEFRIQVDGETRLSVAPGGTLLAFASPDPYEIRFNGSDDAPDASCDWGLGHFAMASPAPTIYDGAAALLSMRELVVNANVYGCMTRTDTLVKRRYSTLLEGSAQDIDWQAWGESGSGSFGSP